MPRPADPFAHLPEQAAIVAKLIARGYSAPDAVRLASASDHRRLAHRRGFIRRGWRLRSK